MRRIFSLLIVGLLFCIPKVDASTLRENTDDLIDQIGATASALSTSLDEFSTYLNNNVARVSEVLDIETLMEINEYLQNNDYNGAFNLLETKVDDNNLTSLNIASKINQYLDLKGDLITFVNSNNSQLNITSGTNEGIECSFDLYDKIRDSFNLAKPKLSNMLQSIKKVFIKTFENHINSNKNIKSDKVKATLDEYNNLFQSLSNLIEKYTNSLDDYGEIFKVISGSETLFEVTIKKKFSNEFNQVLDDIETSLKDKIDEFVNKRWEILETDVSDITTSEKTIKEKNEDIYSKIDQVNDVNDKFVSAINSIIGNLDISSIKAKINLILERGNNEFTNAIKYLENHFVIGEYDINLALNHDLNISINRAKEIIILDKIFTSEAFKNQIELANGVGVLEFNFNNHDIVPNKASVIIKDNEQTKKEYNVVVKGDVNNNAAITISDAIEAAYGSVGLKKLDQYEFLAADMNDNGSITITDVYLIAVASVEGGI